MKKAAVIGNPIKHSKSPLIHNYWLKKYKIEGSYEAIKAENNKDFENVIDKIVEQGYSGFNVTVPFKEKAYELLSDVADYRIDNKIVRDIDEPLLYPDRVCLKAMNTIKIKRNVDGSPSFYGINTDYFGFACSLWLQLGLGEIDNYLDFDLHSNIRNIVILGAGGSARTIANGLMLNRSIYFGLSNLIILNRDEGRAKLLCADLNNISKRKRDKKHINIMHGSINDFNKMIKDCDLLINCTTIGMLGGAETPEFDLENAKSSMIFYDLVYNPLKTPLMEKVKETGLKAIGGLGMLINQAAPAFRIFYQYLEKDYKNRNNIPINVHDMTNDQELWKLLKEDI